MYRGACLRGVLRRGGGGGGAPGAALLQRGHRGIAHIHPRRAQTRARAQRQNTTTLRMRKRKQRQRSEGACHCASVACMLASWPGFMSRAAAQCTCAQAQHRELSQRARTDAATRV
jgi:hypothetical protein